MKKSKLAIASFIFGFFWWIPFIGVIFGVLGIIFGALALSEIRKRPNQLEGFWLAVFGIILGATGCIIWGLLAIWGIMKLASFFYPAIPKPPFFSWPTDPTFWTIIGTLIGVIPMLLLVVLATGLIGFAFWIWMIIDCALKAFEKPADKVAWLILIIFTNWIGATIYFFARRAGRKKLAK